MGINKVKVTCPDCGHDEADFFGFYTFSDNETELKQNHYACLKCNHPFLVPRTDENLHPEHIKKK